MPEFLKVGPNSWVRADALASVLIDEEGNVQVGLVSGISLGVRPGEDADAVCKLVGAKTAEERKREKEQQREKEREKEEEERKAAERAAQPAPPPAPAPAPAPHTASRKDRG